MAGSATGAHAIDGNPLQPVDEPLLQIAGNALVDARGIDEAVAQHHLALR